MPHAARLAALSEVALEEVGELVGQPLQIAGESALGEADMATLLRETQFDAVSNFVLLR